MKPTSRLKPSYFIKAAEILASRRLTYCCGALNYIYIYKTLPFDDAKPAEYIAFLAKHFKPAKHGMFWWKLPFEAMKMAPRHRYDPTEARILALLLCAEILKDDQS